jgi:cellulose synthase/poly-beta-1,6-N-acetylglucosamine synthase-like glycosyltransferase
MDLNSLSRSESWSLAVLAVGTIVVFYTYIGYPLLLIAVAKLRGSRRTQNREAALPYISVVIPAYNEETTIGPKIQNTLQSDYPVELREVIVVSDASTDNTDEIVLSCNDPQVRLVRMPERRGKTHAQNIGVRNARGEVLVFSDATTMYDSAALRELVQAYDDPAVAAASGQYHYVPDSHVQSPTTLGATTFSGYDNLIRKLQAQIETLTGCSGCIYSVRAELYEALPDSSCSDLVLALQMVRRGRRVAYAAKAMAFEYATRSLAQEFHMRVRVITHGIRSLIDMRDLLNVRRHGWIALQLISHKLLRWSMPFCLIAILAGTVGLVRVPVVRWLLIGQLVFYGGSLGLLWLPLHRRWRILSLPLYFCVLNLAVFPGVLEVLRGNKFTTWETARKQHS